MKNSYYNIGNYVISIESIEEIIIKGTYDKSKKKDSFIDYKGMFLNEKTFLNIEKNKRISILCYICYNPFCIDLYLNSKRIFYF